MSGAALNTHCLHQGLTTVPCPTTRNLRCNKLQLYQANLPRCIPEKHKAAELRPNHCAQRAAHQCTLCATQ